MSRFVGKHGYPGIAVPVTYYLLVQEYTAETARDSGIAPLQHLLRSEIRQEGESRCTSIFGNDIVVNEGRYPYIDNLGHFPQVVADPLPQLFVGYIAVQFVTLVKIVYTRCGQCSTVGGVSGRDEPDAGVG
mgnify:CR=1 FL=1